MYWYDVVSFGAEKFRRLTQDDDDCHFNYMRVLYDTSLHCFALHLHALFAHYNEWRFK